ncbi:MAG: hypothetical protein VX424_06195 [Actinomycetota bacterium]|nr:hypothetical protein [Actinomycetota bacterium]
MTRHACPRCGYEARCARGSWPDRHPAAAVMLAVLVLAMAVAHPWLLGLVAAAATVYGVRHARLRRQAVARRADYEHQQLMAQALQWPPPPQLPRRRHRPADHWSPTEPLRQP